MDFHCTKRKRVNNPQLIPWEDMQELHNDMHFWILDGTWLPNSVDAANEEHRDLRTILQGAFITFRIIFFEWHHL